MASTITSMSDLVNTNSSATTLGPSPTYYYPGAGGLVAFHMWYVNVHGYLASLVCAFGIIANVFNIVVLTRKNMVSSTNCLLTGLAISDGLTMLAYLPFALRFYCLYGTQPSPERNSLPAIRYMLFFACFSVVVHTVSIWLTVTLAIFRYLFVRYPRCGTTTCNLARAKLAMFLVLVVTIVVCIPNFITICVQPIEESGTNQTLWRVGFKAETKMDIFIYNFNFWIQAILVKLVPCVGLTILSILLIRTMQRAEARRRKLRNLSGKDESGREKKTHRTTRMLLVVVALFLLTEFPQGILSLLNGLLPYFVEEVYGPLGDLIDILALINNGINFLLYCTMSKQFRDTFIDIFFVPLKGRAKQFTPLPLSPSARDTQDTLT